MKSLRKNLFHASLIPAVMVLALILSAGCSSRKVSQSGTLNDYTRLEKDPMGDKGAMFWQSPDVDFKKYTKFIVEPVTFYFSPKTLEQMPDTLKNERGEFAAELMNKGAAYFEEQIKAALPPEFEVVEDAGPDVARLKPVITGIFADTKALKAYQYVPVALVLTGLSEATGNRDKVALASMEGQVFDSMTGNVIAEVLQQSGIDMDVKNLKTTEDVDKLDMLPNFDYWAEKLKKRLLSAHQ